MLLKTASDVVVGRLAMYNDAAEPVGQTLDIGFEIREPGRYSLVAGVLHWRGCKAADTLLADLIALAICD